MRGSEHVRSGPANYYKRRQALLDRSVLLDKGQISLQIGEHGKLKHANNLPIPGLLGVYRSFRSSSHIEYCTTVLSWQS